MKSIQTWIVSLLLLVSSVCSFVQQQVSRTSTRPSINENEVRVAPVLAGVVNDRDGANSDDNVVDSQETHAAASQLGSSTTSRREFAVSALASLSAGFAAPVLAQDENTAASGELTVLKTPSGLKYIDLEPGTGPKPAYGQLTSIQYEAYIKLPASKDEPNPKPQLYEKQTAYLMKHGNGRTIAGLDEGIHTMRVNGKRRLLIPPKLGYVDSGLGPIPEYPWDRNKLNRLLDQMVAVAGGTLIFEVRLLSVMDDEADQGYYQDASLTPEEFQQLRDNLQKKAKLGQASQ